MATTTPKAQSPDAASDLIDAWIVPDPYKPGRHNAVFRGGRTHLWAVLAHLRDDHSNLADVAKSHGLPEDALYAAIAYRDRHRALFDADQLLRDEEWNS